MAPNKHRESILSKGVCFIQGQTDEFSLDFVCCLPPPPAEHFSEPDADVDGVMAVWR